LHTKQGSKQYYTIELATFTVDFVPLAVEFGTFAVEFIGLAVEFVVLALQFVILAMDLCNGIRRIYFKIHHACTGIRHGCNRCKKLTTCHEDK